MSMVRTHLLRIIGATIAAVCVMTAHGFGAEAEGPRISIKEPRFDFGTVKEGDQPEHIFEIKNVGDSVLAIFKVQPT